MISLPPARLQPAEYNRLVKLLALHYASPLPYPLSGAHFEELFASAVGGVREEKKLLFDVLLGEIGWSLKTVLQSNTSKGASFEVIIQRCDILKDHTLSLASPVELLGERILAHFNNFARRSATAQNVADPRAGFLLRNRAQRDFIFFQQRHRLYTSAEVTWRWANSNKNSLMGFENDRLIFRWYRSGTQLFGIYQIPLEAHIFHLDWTRANVDATIAFFIAQGVMRIEEDS